MSGEAVMEDASKKFVQLLQDLKSRDVIGGGDINFTISIKPQVVDHLFKIAREKGAVSCLEAYLKLFVVILERGTSLTPEETIQLLDAMTQ